MTNSTNNEKLSYGDRKNWFRYHTHNIKVNEENAWKQINEMIRILYKDYLEKHKDYLGNLTVLTILYIAYLENILIQIFGFVNIVT